MQLWASAILGSGYAIDTSSLMEVARCYSPSQASRVWDGIVGLIKNGRLKSSEFVMEELERNDAAAYQRLRQHRSCLVVSMTPVLAGEAGQIAYRFPKMSRPRNPRERGDTWVIAIAKVHTLIVVCNESTSDGKKQKMPWVCGQLGVQCEDLQWLVQTEQLL